MHNLHLQLKANDAAFLWAQKQADSVGALGHVGTHLDCYTKEPQQNYYEIDAYIIDCRDHMLTLKEALNLPSLVNQALILRTDNLTYHEYGSKEYFNYESHLDLACLKAILDHKPSFIVIDSHGIGKPSNEHQSFDKLCEEHNCHVIENVDLSSTPLQGVINIQIEIDLNIASSGKPCKIYYQG